jgi:hypothetical protein
MNDCKVHFARFGAKGKLIRRSFKTDQMETWPENMTMGGFTIGSPLINGQQLIGGRQ